LTNIARDFYGANEDITSVIPWQSWPKKTDGVEKMSVILTPTDINSTIQVNMSGVGSNPNSDSSITAALFIDDDEYAAEVVTVNPNGPNYMSPFSLSFSHEPNDLLPHTYRIRFGSAASGHVIRMNGTGAGPSLGGALKCRLEVMELV
jgi:hypothetical protein